MLLRKKRMRVLRAWVASALSIPEPAVGQLPIQRRDQLLSFHAELSPEMLRDWIEQLPAPRSRIHAPTQIAESDQLLTKILTETGWSVEHQPVSAAGKGGRLDHGSFGPTRYDGLEGRNIVATLRGTAPDRAVVLLAHQDTVKDSPGANDNGSALAVLLATARLLGAARSRSTIVLAVTDMEEIGMFGAHALATELRRRFRSMVAINLETIGYLSSEPDTQGVPQGFGVVYPDQTARVRRGGYRGDFLAVLYNRGAEPAASTFAAALAELQGRESSLLIRALTDIPIVSGILRGFVPVVAQLFRGDQVPFWEAGVPALQITDTANMRYPQYHTPNDTPEHLNYEHLRDVAAATSMTLAALADAWIPARHQRPPPA